MHNATKKRMHTVIHFITHRFIPAFKQTMFDVICSQVHVHIALSNGTTLIFCGMLCFVAKVQEVLFPYGGIFLSSKDNEGKAILITLGKMKL